MKKESAALVMPAQKLLNKAQAAHVMGISRRTLSDLIRAKRIPTVRLSRVNVLLKVEDLENFIEQHRTWEVPEEPAAVRKARAAIKRSGRKTKSTSTSGKTRDKLHL
jgi:excisionase family DNA binding protein